MKTAVKFMMVLYGLISVGMTINAADYGYIEKTGRMTNPLSTHIIMGDNCNSSTYQPLLHSSAITEIRPGIKVKIPKPHQSAKRQSLENYTSVDKDFKPLAIFNEFVNEDDVTYSLIYKLYCRREESKIPKSLRNYAPGIKVALEKSQERMEAHYRSNPSYVSHQPPEILENNDFFTNSQDWVFEENDVLMRGYSLFSLFNIHEELFQIRIICRYENSDGYAGKALAKSINAYALNNLFEWRDAILAANKEQP